MLVDICIVLFDEGRDSWSVAIPAGGKQLLMVSSFLLLACFIEGGVALTVITPVISRKIKRKHHAACVCV